MDALSEIYLNMSRHTCVNIPFTFERQAQLHGAEVSSEVREGVTHLVCLVGDEAPDTSPAALLEAVTKQGGGPPAVAALKKGLEQGEISLVTTG